MYGKADRLEEKENLLVTKSRYAVRIYIYHN